MSVWDAARRLGLRVIPREVGWDCICAGCRGWGCIRVNRYQPSKWSCNVCGSGGDSIDYVCIKMLKRPYDPSMRWKLRSWFTCKSNRLEEERLARLAKYQKDKPPPT